MRSEWYDTTSEVLGDGAERNEPGQLEVKRATKVRKAGSFTTQTQAHDATGNERGITATSQR
jgi:hypothetical protein